LEPYRVLVIGPRRALLEALRTRAIPFDVWQERAVPGSGAAGTVLTAPLWNTTEKLKATLAEAFAGEHYTHVIAGTDAAVYPAAVARREVGARHSPTTTALRCRDKLAMKEYLAGHAIPMTDFMAEADAPSPAAVVARLGMPVVRKRRKSSGGRGLELIDRAGDLLLRRDGRNILERYVDAPEASVESFIQQGEIRFVNTTRYLEKRHVNFVPAAFDAALQAAIGALNHRVIEALRIRWGMTHLEVYLADHGLLFGEIALRPPGGYIMNALHHAYGFDPWAALLAVELGEPFDFPADIAAYAGVELFHPGAGRITAIRGREQVQQHPATREFRLKIRPGDTLGTRDSAGQDVGYVLYTGDTPAARLAVHRAFEQAFEIIME
jgi:biotin carboxylase